MLNAPYGNLEDRCSPGPEKVDGGGSHLGDDTTLDLRSELKASARLSGLKADGDVSKLARASGLLLVDVPDVRLPADGLAVVDLGSSHITVHLELSSQAVHNDAASHVRFSRPEPVIQSSSPG